MGYSPADSAQTIGDIVRVLRKDSPETRIYIESVLPSRAPKFSRWGAQLNERLRAMADGEKIFYIDLRPAFVDADGNLDVRYTVDGLHLLSFA